MDLKIILFICHNISFTTISNKAFDINNKNYNYNWLYSILCYLTINRTGIFMEEECSTLTGKLDKGRVVTLVGIMENKVCFYMQNNTQMCLKTNIKSHKV